MLAAIMPLLLSIFTDASWLRLSSKHTFPYTADQYLYRHGPRIEDKLFNALGDRVRPHGRAELIQRCV